MLWRFGCSFSMGPVKRPPAIRHCERSEAISSSKARLLRCARKDEFKGLVAAALTLKSHNEVTF